MNSTSCVYVQTSNCLSAEKKDVKDCQNLIDVVEDLTVNSVESV